jgi:hypothetical protein
MSQEDVANLAGDRLPGTNLELITDRQKLKPAAPKVGQESNAFHLR